MEITMTVNEIANYKMWAQATSAFHVVIAVILSAIGAYMAFGRYRKNVFMAFISSAGFFTCAFIIGNLAIREAKEFREPAMHLAKKINLGIIRQDKSEWVVHENRYKDSVTAVFDDRGQFIGFKGEAARPVAVVPKN